MELNLKSFHKCVIAVVCLTGCGPSTPPTPHRCQAIFVLDKTNSVAYDTGSHRLEQELARDFQQSYGFGTTGIQCSRFIIKENSMVFPEIDKFDEAYPGGPEDSRETQQMRQRWNMKKREWIFDEVHLMDSLINCPCNANTTDIFPIFSGIQQVQSNNEPEDTINVYIFSDMINTTSQENMVTMKTTDIFEKGRSVCRNMLQQKHIFPLDTGNLYLKIYAPKTMKNSDEVQRFWNGFFDQWGLPKSHCSFEII